ncbi:MAG: hypothetical protein JWM34_4814 [Ilumatobacteraceae bacterium]|nr:hypothetical protein [Ilumatobacteraceae bacterium]
MFDDNDMKTAAITFRLPAAVDATTAAVLGDFNDWDATAHPMDRAPD